MWSDLLILSLHPRTISEPHLWSMMDKATLLPPWLHGIAQRAPGIDDFTARTISTLRPWSDVDGLWPLGRALSLN